MVELIVLYRQNKINLMVNLGIIVIINYYLLYFNVYTFNTGRGSPVTKRRLSWLRGSIYRGNYFLHNNLTVNS